PDSAAAFSPVTTLFRSVRTPGPKVLQALVIARRKVRKILRLFRLPRPETRLLTRRKRIARTHVRRARLPEPPIRPVTLVRIVLRDRKSTRLNSSHVKIS